MDKQMDVILKELVKRANSTNRRLRSLEERVDTLETKLLTIEQTITKQNEDFKDMLLQLKAELSEHESQSRKLGKAVEILKEKIKQSATKADVKEIERMIELLDPLKNDFITREEAEKMLEGD